MFAENARSCICIRINTCDFEKLLIIVYTQRVVVLKKQRQKEREAEEVYTHMHLRFKIILRTNCLKQY